MHILAQVDWEQAAILFAACVTALGGTRGLERLIGAWRGRRNGTWEEGPAAGNGKYVSEDVCLVRHGEQEKLQNVRHQALAQALREVRDNVGRIHERIDDLANHKGG